MDEKCVFNNKLSVQSVENKNRTGFRQKYTILISIHFHRKKSTFKLVGKTLRVEIPGVARVKWNKKHFKTASNLGRFKINILQQMSPALVWSQLATSANYSKVFSFSRSSRRFYGHKRPDPTNRSVLIFCFKCQTVVILWLVSPDKHSSRSFTNVNGRATKKKYKAKQLNWSTMLLNFCKSSVWTFALSWCASLNSFNELKARPNGWYITKEMKRYWLV